MRQDEKSTFGHEPLMLEMTLVKVAIKGHKGIILAQKLGLTYFQHLALQEVMITGIENDF